MEALSAVIACALFWLPRIAVISLALTAVVWLASQTVKWLVPAPGDPVPEFEVVGQTGADMKALLPRLLNAEFMRIKADLKSGAKAVERQLEAWQREFQDARQRREGAQAREENAREALAATPPAEPRIAASEVRGGVDLTLVGEATEKLQLLSTAIAPTNVPEIKIASVELGPVLRWLVELFRTPSANKIVVFDSSSALIEGPIIKDGPVILALNPLAQGTQRTAQQTVEPIAYHILSSKLSSSEPRIDFGGWTAMRDFVLGATGLAKLVSDPKPGPAEMEAWRADMVKAAQRIENAGTAAREWRFLALASFLFERAEDFDDAIRVLDRYAELAPQNAQREREARLAYLRERQVERAVSAALKAQESGGAAFAATASALARLPTMIAVQKLHRLGSLRGEFRVRVALIAGAKPPWFGIDRPAEAHPLEDVLDQYGAQLAQIVRALAPSADIVFVPVRASVNGTIQTGQLVAAFEKAAASEAEIILLPFGPLIEAAVWGRAFDAAVAKGKLVIAPAGNSGPMFSQVLDDLASKILVAESIDTNGEYSDFSSRVPGALAAAGSVLPYVTLTDAGPTVVVGKGTGLAAATLAAVAVETVARQPTLKGAALRDALTAAARPSSDGGRIARVAIPR